MNDFDFLECENIDTVQFLSRMKDLSKNFKPEFQGAEELIEHKPEVFQEYLEFSQEIDSDLQEQRLQMIKDKINGMGEDELNVQAIKLELAVHRLSNTIFDQLAVQQSKYEKYAQKN